MTREWKPGDVAAFTIDGKPLVCIRDLSGRWSGYRDGNSWERRPWDRSHDQRPLVVIDPEDREQVERLLTVMADRGWFGLDEEAPNDMQAALREFANPKPPKPDEPMGLGAVVEDSEGRRWVSWRCGLDSHERPWQLLEMDEDEFRNWAEIAVAKVLFDPGVSDD